MSSTSLSNDTSNVSEENAINTEVRTRSIRDERLNFPPIYVVVGIYRLCTDKKLYIPVWKKCKHGFIRGAVVGLTWGLLTYNIQRIYVQYFLVKTSHITGLADETLFGYKLPFTLTTYATLILLSQQITHILEFFLYRNIRIARDRAWDQTVTSRGKDASFWIPYVEEWEKPPNITQRNWEKWVGMSFGRFLIRRALFFHIQFYPLVGLCITAYLKALGAARYLHAPYFAAKKMTRDQIAIFMEERRRAYQAFGFAAALAENIPIIGLLFTVSNRIGAAMWAHDLEKRQHALAAGELKPLPPPSIEPNTPSESGKTMIGEP